MIDAGVSLLIEEGEDVFGICFRGKCYRKCNDGLLIAEFVIAPCDDAVG